MASRKTFLGLEPKPGNYINLPIDEFNISISGPGNPNGLYRWMEIFTKNTDLSYSRFRGVVPNAFSSENDFIILLYFLTFYREFKSKYNFNDLEICPRFHYDSGPRHLANLEIMVRYLDDESINKFNEILSKYYYIDSIVNDG